MRQQLGQHQVGADQFGDVGDVGAGDDADHGVAADLGHFQVIAQ